MESDDKLVEWFDDGHSAFGWTLVFQPSEYSVDFKAYEIRGSTNHQSLGAPPLEPMYENFGWERCGDEVQDLKLASPQIRGMVKWDGCSHVRFGNSASAEDERQGEVDGYLHLCGESEWRSFGTVMARCFDRCRDLLRASGKWDE